MRPSLTVPIAIVVAGLIVAAAVYVTLAPTGDGAPRAELVRPVGAEDHILGSPTAPVKIVEYCDFESDYCRAFEETLHQLIADEGADGTVAWVYRHFPLTELHPNALTHARASECAAEVAGNDGFWRFSTALYKNQPVLPSQYGTIASSVGITSDAFATCYASAAATFDAKIMANRQNALDMGAQGAPFSIVLVDGSAGRRSAIVLDGAYSYDAVREIIAQALAQ